MPKYCGPNTFYFSYFLKKLLKGNERFRDCSKNYSKIYCSLDFDLDLAEVGLFRCFKMGLFRCFKISMSLSALFWP